MKATADDVRAGLAELVEDVHVDLRAPHDVLVRGLEGERELNWYHRLDLGFAGRRRLPPG